MNEPIQHSSSVALAAERRGEAREKCAGDGRWRPSVFENRLSIYIHVYCITMYIYVYLGIYISFCDTILTFYTVGLYTLFLHLGGITFSYIGKIDIFIGLTVPFLFLYTSAGL